MRKIALAAIVLAMVFGFCYWSAEKDHRDFIADAQKMVDRNYTGSDAENVIRQKIYEVAPKHGIKLEPDAITISCTKTPTQGHWGPAHYFTTTATVTYKRMVLPPLYSKEFKFTVGKHKLHEKNVRTSF